MTLPHNSIDLSQSPDALHAKWTNVNSLPELAFDHTKIVKSAIDRIKMKLNYSTIASAFLPKKFKLSDFQRVHEVILGQSLDKRNFRKKMQSLKIIEPTGETDKSGNHRPASLYRFCSDEVISYE